MLRVSPDEAQAVSQDAVFMPLETPLDMPAQDLAFWPPGKAITRWRTSRQVIAARLTDRDSGTSDLGEDVLLFGITAGGAGGGDGNTTFSTTIHYPAMYLMVSS